MTIEPIGERTPPAQIRLWPGVVIVVLQCLLRYMAPIVSPEAMPFAVAGGVLGGLAVVLWWLFFSRAPWFDRLGAVGLLILAVAATPRFTHASIQNGMMGMLFFISAIPVVSLAFVVGAVASSSLSAGSRRLVMLASILLGCGVWTLVRTGGITGNGDSDFAWRWSVTAEERLLARAGEDSTSLTASALLSTKAGDWPGFRGPNRDDVVRGVRIKTDWAAAPPVELWRRPIGPGWSSFAVRGNLLYTQEQRGDEEIVSCHSLTTGQLLWMHRDTTRFWESNAGAGPRATPALRDGQVYTFGATGILNALDAEDGSVVWSRNAASETEARIPGWGFSSSPLVIDDIVIVHARVLVAFDRATGDRRWIGPARGGGYSSPHLVAIDGVPQILLISGAGITSVAPAAGTLLWEHPWPGVPILQPALVGGSDILISTADMMGGMGIRRLAITHRPGEWVAHERWTSRSLKPYFNDFVVHKDHAFGFDGFILACIDIEDGSRKWKGGRYGNGQLVLLPDQDLLLVLSEEGELALVGATPDKFTELARVRALEGKTWNHPVLVGDTLLVRNGQEMVAFRLPLAGR